MIIDKKSYIEFCVSDRVVNDKLSIKHSKFKRFIFQDLILKFLKLLRKCEYLKNCRKDILGVVLFYFYYYKFINLSRKLSFTIPLNVFGPGLSVPHYGTIIVNHKAKVGKNCRIHACVNIGASGGSNLAPQIGDNVYIGPGAILFGDIFISDNVTIAANATVNKSIDVANVTVGGTPAKILKQNSSVWWEKNKLKLEL